MWLTSLVALLLLLARPTTSLCPFAKRHVHGEGLPSGHPRVDRPAAADSYVAALAALDLDAVKEDLRQLFITSQDQWPADYGHYGPFMIRLAWHCAGSYRLSDGRGGCDGGRQRFDPERSWEDNTNLDKARALLWPVKEKYGLGLSWGDLFILAGTTAIESMGGPTIGFCAGRIDDTDGADSLQLGPSREQDEIAPCPVEGACPPPLGASTVGLIYVNPEGPQGNPVPSLSAADVRDTFARMGMNDRETVALIGGGHAFGKTHGACPAGAGPSPKEDPANPWPGLCGTGVGVDTYTSGFEGPWVPTPTTWSNSYFSMLLNFQWEVWTGPGNHSQWRVIGNTTPTAPGVVPGGPREPIMMLTSDLSLLNDPTNSYQQYVQEFAQDSLAFDDAFAQAWYKLTARDMGPHARCVGDDVPPPQPWQFPLPPPPPPTELPNFDDVREAISRAIVEPNPVLPPDEYNGQPYYGALFVRLAWACASTFRSTDYLGGCNGARLRFSPQRDWPVNTALDGALAVLLPVKEQFGDPLSWADLIALSGTVALEEAGAPPMEFCGGRTDAPVYDGGSDDLEPRVIGLANETLSILEDFVDVMGVTKREFVALLGGGHSLGQMHPERSGFMGQWTQTPMTLNNEYFRNLFAESWSQIGSDASTQYKATIGGGTNPEGQEIYALGTDLQLRWEPTFAAIGEEYASDEVLFLQEFSAAWTKMMQIDRFDGPTGNICSNDGMRDDAMYRCEDNGCVLVEESSSDGNGIDRASCEALCGVATRVENDASTDKKIQSEQGGILDPVLSSLLAGML